MQVFGLWEKLKKGNGFGSVTSHKWRKFVLGPNSAHLSVKDINRGHKGQVIPKQLYWK